MQLPGHGDLDLHPGEGVLVPPHQERGPWARDGAPAYFILIFENHGLDIDGVCLRRLRLSDRSDAVLGDLVRALRQPGRWHPKLERYLLASRLLISLAEDDQAEQPSRLNETTRHAVLEQADAYIRSHIDRDLRCRDVAAAVHLSEPQLNRILRAQCGMSTGERILHWRIEHATLLLRSSSMSITQVALASGFSSLSWFAKAFRRQTGSLPTEVRKAGLRWFARKH
ncbi:MAG: helix-turn-helix domain-containing protein [Planctomycetota bacterium]